MLSRIRALRACVRRFVADAAGVAAIEFVVIAPVLVLLLLGVSDYVPSLVARYKASHANGSFGDLITQASALQQTDVATYYAAAGQVIAPFDSTPLVLQVTNVYSDGQGHAYVYWSCGQGALPPMAAKSAVANAANGVPVGNLLWLYNVGLGGRTYNGTNTSFIMVESQYTYTAPAQFVLKGPQTMSSVYIVYPRQSAYVGFPWDGNANDAPPQPTSTTRTASMTLSNGAVCNYAL